MFFGFWEREEKQRKRVSDVTRIVCEPPTPPRPPTRLLFLTRCLQVHSHWWTQMVLLLLLPSSFPFSLPPSLHPSCSEGHSAKLTVLFLLSETLGCGPMMPFQQRRFLAPPTSCCPARVTQNSWGARGPCECAFNGHVLKKNGEVVRLKLKMKRTDMSSSPGDNR